MLGLALLAFIPATEAAPSGTIIPAYMWAEDAGWDVLLSAAAESSMPRENIHIVVNANNGVTGSLADSEKAIWQQLADRVQPAGRLLAYLNLCDRVPPFDTCGDAQLQGARPAAEMLQYAADWIDMLGADRIDGFFLDDTPMSGMNGDNVAEIINGIKALNSRFMVVTNPGTAATDRALVDMVDATVNVENSDPSGTVATSACCPNALHFLYLPSQNYT